MKRFKMAFEMDNAAFDENHGYDEVVRILRLAANEMEQSGGLIEKLGIFIDDINGNKIGKYYITKDKK